MEKLISRQLLSKVRNENLNESIKMFSQAKESRERNKYSFEISIFLSHKHNETEIIRQAIALFKRLGISVYVDWLDSEMPKTTNGYTPCWRKRLACAPACYRDEILLSSGPK